MRIFILIFLFISCNSKENPWDKISKTKLHTDHSYYFKDQFKKPQDVTKSCLKCHETVAGNFMKTAHWTWLSDEVNIPGRKEKVKIGKKNLINNFCLSINGNWSSCTSCHAGYGWKDNKFDFNKKENIDCLICHDSTGDYAKGKAGIPSNKIDLLQIAKKVSHPSRENCGKCHFYGGGGMGVKHGDLDITLLNPSEDLDVHMGKHKLTCVDCHKTIKHNITGKAYSVSVDHKNGINCTDCHSGKVHKNDRINLHVKSVACQTCHIPTYARKVPTKMFWDWSKAGNDKRENDPHTYLKIKGEFKYEQNIVPEYYWFNLKVGRYLTGDKIDPSKVIDINTPLGSKNDKTAKIWPFKVHRATQPYDTKNKYLIPPVTSGEGGYWREFNWHKALKLGAQNVNLSYSGSYDFVKTQMYWPLSHMIVPKNKALKCKDCHGNKRFDWKMLGYDGDPIKVGGR